jgi:hypothetical protein
MQLEVEEDIMVAVAVEYQELITQIILRLVAVEVVPVL